jgi:hypothetical protein
MFGGWILLLIPILNLVNVRMEHFEASSTIVATAFFFAIVALCLWMRSVAAACILLLIPQTYICALINPIEQGVPGITHSQLFHWLTEVHHSKPEGKWLVLGQTFRADVLPDFVKATGATVLGGTRCNPDREMLAILDPAKEHDALTQRYAWIHLKRGDAAEPVFEAGPDLSYTIKIPLTQPFLDALDVRHILEVDSLSDQEIPPGFHLVGSRLRTRLLERD